MLAKPQTYMNLSGTSVQPLMEKHEIGLDRLIMVYDELDLPWGTLKIKPAKKYAHRGTKGTFTTKGKHITFHKGDLNKMTGRFLKTTEGRWEIALRNPKDDFESIYCDQNK